MNRNKILVVDDEADIIMYLDTLLKDNGYDVLQARSVKEAREIMEQVKPDLVCLDIMMPKQSGIALYRELKLDDGFKDIPVIFISAFSLARDFYGSEFRKLIPDRRVPEPENYLEKPVQPAKLLAAIEKVIG